MQERDGVRLRSAPLSEPPRNVAFVREGRLDRRRRVWGLRDPRPRTRGWPIPRDRPRSNHRSGARAFRQQTARPTRGHAKGRAIPRRAKGRAFQSRAKGRGAPESRQGTRRTRVAAGRSWLLDARAAQGSVLVLEVAPRLRGP